MNFSDIVILPFSFANPSAGWIVTVGLILIALVCLTTALGLVLHFRREEKKQEKKREKRASVTDEE